MQAKIAVVQKPPVFLDREATIARAVEAIDEAADAGAALVIFPEAWIPGYPTWVWRLKPGTDMALSSELHARLRSNAVDIERDDLEPLQQVASQRAVTIVVGVNEIDSRFSGTTLFNTVVVIGPDGTLQNRHRKLMPTNPERMVWGTGDASGLRVVDTPVGRLGCLICWESYMPLARYALYAQNIDILINPTWDNGELCLATLRHIAREGGCWVIGTATAMQGSDLPADFPDRDRLFKAEEWINDGDAVVVKPGGAIAAGPLNRDKGILFAEIDSEAVGCARRSLDVAGHYSRPDIFSLSINRKPLTPVAFTD
ncbi:carbon-nitrogen hydrolase family protein [Mesorhizobium sp.]|uniref:carbon-nitrogen hydrolase family protein n=1 Tax=Mesorhizobium sp. TaxID=1871066 RepID=UPI000FE710A4|nr:carbon-nitrogen hydrolase family protein [Mesorhizobium sp.]RWC01399.1 MAG: carbon-nitrogen hydrolase family protein [Mesorhizobium sp.]RWP69912.1 MAG: carbon-nitrogen hydrolase family protein [Mesorhizobium sp.]